ncbi:hypothetical protein, partial [Sediminibacterium sp. Gen4]
NGTGRKRVELDTPLRKHTFVGTVQHAGESAGQVAAQEADQGGQILMYNFDNLFPKSQSSI